METRKKLRREDWIKFIEYKFNEPGNKIVRDVLFDEFHEPSKIVWACDKEKCSCTGTWIEDY